MNREEFVAKRDKYNRLMLPVKLCGILAGLGVMFLVVCLSPPGCLKGLPWYFMVPAIGLLLSPLFGACYLSEWLVNRYLAVKCPHCEKVMNMSLLGYLVVATGNCPHCGNRVLDGPSDQATSTDAADHPRPPDRAD
jgi:phage FluMu protein Com